MAIELLDKNHRDAIIGAFENAKQRIRIISPFVQESMTRYLADSAGRGLTSQLITRFYHENFIKSVSSRTNNVIEQLNLEIHCRTRVVGAFS